MQRRTLARRIADRVAPAAGSIPVRGAALPRRARAGFTLIELVISVALLGMVIGSAAMVSSSGYRLYQATSLESDVEARAKRALDRLAMELKPAARSSLVPDPVGNLGVASMQFAQGVDFTGAGVIVLGPPLRILFERDGAELANGVDDDNDGLVDEGSLVLVRDEGGPDERRVVLVNRVRALLEGETANLIDDNGNGLIDEPGFCVQRVDDLLTMRLSVEELGPYDERIVRTVETSVWTRN